MDRKNHWKAQPLPFDSQEARLVRANRNEARRRQQRTQNLERIRHIQRIDNEAEIVEAHEDRSARLLRWKAERDLKKKVEAKKKLPPFKVGIPHHKFWSPTAGETKPEKKPKGPSPPKKISMVTQRRLAAKAAATGPSGNRDGSQPSGSTVMTPPRRNVVNRRVSLVPDNYPFKIPSGVPAIPLLEDSIYPDAKSALLDFNLPMPPQITLREKLTQQNSDKSGPIKRSSPYEDVPMKDTVLQNLNISVEEEERTAQHYKFLVQREENRLRNLCKVWEKIQGQPETSEDGHYIINQAIGQTNLLMGKKFERFRNLISDCETGRGEQLVVCRDLQGFWAIVEREIRDCDSRFTKLEELKAKNWKEEEEPEVTVVKKKPAAMKKKKIASNSNMRSFIEAARKKKLSPKNAMDEDVPEEPKMEVELVSKTPRKTLPMFPCTENFELQEGLKTPPVIPVFMITVPTPSETIISPQPSENDAVTKRRSKVIINVTQATPAGGVPSNGENSRTDEVETGNEPMPALRLLRKCRIRFASPVGTENIENTSTRGRKKSSEEKVEDSEVPVRMQTRSQSVLMASAAAGKKFNSQKKGSVELKELRCCSGDVGDKENAITMAHQRSRTPTTPLNLLDVNHTPLRRSPRKSVKIIPKDDCPSGNRGRLTPKSSTSK